MKKIILATALIAVIAMGCGSSPKATGADELDIAIREASDYLNDNIPAGSKIVILNVQSDSLALSNYIIDELIANAVNDKIFSVVDRQQLDLIRAEQNFQFSGEVDDALALDIGKFFGAQSIVSGTISPLGDRYRMTVRALEVQTAQVQGQFNRNMDADKTITALMRSGGSSGTATATGGRSGTSGSGTASGGGTQTATPAVATPARPTIKNGTYTFWPRPRAMKQGRDINAYLEKIVVRGGYFTVYVVEVPVGNGSNRGDIPENHQSILQDLDNPSRPPLSSRTENSLNNYESANGRFASFWVFENHNIRRFSFTNLFENATFEEIIMPDEPDA